MICPKCNNSLPDDSIACNRCGLLFQYQQPFIQQPQNNQQTGGPLYQHPIPQYNQFIPQQAIIPPKTNKKLILGVIIGIVGLLLLAIIIPVAVLSIPKEIDYGDAESFEQALNDGEDCVGIVVKVKVSEVHPKSFFGYNLWAGEHLNFLSSSNPGIKEGEYLTAKITKVDSTLGSWMIRYKLVKNGKETKNTKYKDK